MTRPMPGPHEHPWTAWYYACTACSGMWEHGDECIRLLKHLSDAECAAEYWQAVCLYWTTNEGAPYADRATEAQRAATWHRFATHPYAVKETHDDRP